MESKALMKPLKNPPMKFMSWCLLRPHEKSRASNTFLIRSIFALGCKECKQYLIAQIGVFHHLVLKHC